MICVCRNTFSRLAMYVNGSPRETFRALHTASAAIWESTVASPGHPLLSDKHAVRRQVSPNYQNFYQTFRPALGPILPWPDNPILCCCDPCTLGCAKPFMPGLYREPPTAPLDPPLNPPNGLCIVIELLNRPPYSGLPAGGIDWPILPRGPYEGDAPYISRLLLAYGPAWLNMPGIPKWLGWDV